MQEVCQLGISYWLGADNMSRRVFSKRIDLFGLNKMDVDNNNDDVNQWPLISPRPKFEQYNMALANSKIFEDFYPELCR